MGDKVTFTDIIKKSVLNLEVFQDIPFLQVLIGLSVSLCVGLFIYYVYQKCYRGVVYSHSFNVTLVLMTMITALVIMTISTNIVLSLGMVGALSIVRFRTAIKDPLDIVFMFWAIAAGIATGATVYAVSIVGSLVLGITVFLLSRSSSRVTAYLLIIHYDETAQGEIRRHLSRMKHVLKSKTVRKQDVELTVEIKMKGDQTGFVNEISMIEGVRDVAVVSYNGDYAP